MHVNKRKPLKLVGVHRASEIAVVGVLMRAGFEALFARIIFVVFSSSLVSRI